MGEKIILQPWQKEIMKIARQNHKNYMESPYGRQKSNARTFLIRERKQTND